MAETIRSSVFFRYEGLTKIGSGSMGTVYKAHDTRLDRVVAVKVLPPGLREDAEAMERFRREACTLALLKHPGVASVYDADAEGDFPHLVMEFVEGENLEQVLRRRGPLTVAEVVRLGIEIAEALEHIHCHRIVHRDIKSANIIIGPEGRTVLVDFGVAYMLSLPRISQGALGTPEYMSPEQADGRPTDGRSDLYSVGVVLYECLTGRVPFRREGEGVSALADMLKRAQEDPPTPVRSHRKDVPPWLEEAVLRCLAKSPEERFTSAAALAVALRKDQSTLAVVVEAKPADQTPRLDDEPVPPARNLLPQAAGSPGLVISHLDSVDSVAFSPNGKRLASTSKDGGIRIWEAGSGQLLHLLKGHTALSTSFSRGGACLASGGADGKVCIWDVYREQVLHRIPAHQGYVLSVAYSRDGKYLASGGIDGAVRIWRARTGRLVRTLGWQYSYVLSVSFSPDGRQLASSSADGAVRIWDAETGEVLHMLKGHSGYIGSVSFSPNGQRLASSGADGMIRVWEVDTGCLLSTLEGHTDWVTSVAFSPDGAHLASGSRDRTVRLWDARTGRVLRRIKGHAAAVTSIAFSPDGASLASGSSDHTVRVWPLSARDFVRRIPHRSLIAAALMIGFAALGIWHEDLPKVDPAEVWTWATTPLSRTTDGVQEASLGPVTTAPKTPTPRSEPLASAPQGRAAKPPAKSSNTSNTRTDTPPAAPQRAEERRRDERPQRPSEQAPPVRFEDEQEVTEGDEASWEPAPSPEEAGLDYEEEAFESGSRLGEDPAPPVGIRMSGEALYSDEGLRPEYGGWTLVVAVEETRMQALRAAGRYWRQGYRVGVMRVLARGKQSYRVGVGQFETQHGASAVRDHLVRGEVVPFNTWLMRIRPVGMP